MHRGHYRGIDLGLERVAAVCSRLCPQGMPGSVVTIAGTNGKGSTAAGLEALLLSAGISTGCFVSPHLTSLNERFRINGENADNAAVVNALERVETVRGQVSLTYFEYCALAALELFANAGLEVIVLEVGLGGRLDAVNVIDANIAVITSIDLDHTDWLGDTREQIGSEKAGIMRSGIPVLCGDRNPPQSLLQRAGELGAALEIIGTDFDLLRDAQGSAWRGQRLSGLRLHSHATALALRAYEVLGFSPGPRQLQQLADLRVPGRCEQRRLQGLDVWLDVAHNPAAVRHLGEQLDVVPRIRTWGLFGAMDNKDIDGMLSLMSGRIDDWVITAIDSERGMDEQCLAGHLRAQGITPRAISGDPVAGFECVSRLADPGESLVVFGSFHTVGPVREYLLGRAA